MCKHDAKILEQQEAGKKKTTTKTNEPNSEIQYSYTKMDGGFLNPVLWLCYVKMLLHKCIKYPAIYFT